MKHRTLLASTLAIALGMVAPATVHAQFSTGGSSQSSSSRNAWEQFDLPNKTVKLNFRNANVDLVLDLFMKVSGITIVKDPNLKDAMTLSTPKAVPIKEAFEVLNAALSVRNYQFEKQGNVLLIKPRREERGGTGFDPAAIAQMMGGTQNVELKVYRVQYASASEVARVINEVFQQQQQANNPFAAFGGGGQGGRGGRGGGGFSFGNFNFGQQQGPTVRASADDFSNSVIVNAPREKQRDVEDLIAEIDKLTDAPLQTRVYTLEFASAPDLVTTVQTVLTANAPQGRGNTGQANQGGFGGFLRRVAGPGQGEANVSADPRSNSLIVSATAEAHKILDTLMVELDKEVEVENTTFVIPLSNARADTVADLLNSAFGSRNTGRGNQFGGNNTNRNNTNQNRNRNTGGGGGGGGLGTGRGVEESAARFEPNSKGENELLLEFEEGSDELYTQVRTQQGGFFGQLGGRQNTQQGGTNNVARNADGRLVNVRDLSGQVSIIPDPNTNSLIIVTAPDNMELVRQILGQLDKIPEQVMIETLIVEATLDSSMKLGVEWNFTQDRPFGNSGTGTGATDFNLGGSNPPLDGLRYTITGQNFSAFLNALSTDDKFQVLSTPRIFTSNNVEAEINISQSVPYILSTREDANGNLTFNYAFQDVGIVLNVVPRITSNGTVTLDVTQTANDLQGFTDFNAPIVNQRQAFTTVSAQDGETIVLGGIMRNTVTSNVRKVPLLGDIPILGELFKSREKSEVKTELLVFLTPRIVRSPEEAGKLRSDEVQRLSPQSQKGVQQSLPPTAKSNSGIKSGPKKEIGND